MHNFFVMFLVCWVSATSAFAWPAKVVVVSDGDTLVVEQEPDGGRIKIRLYGVDAPEKKQPFGAVAKHFVIAKCLFERIEVKALYTDRYKRVVAVITMPNGESLQRYILEAGLAWVSPKYCKSCEKWQLIQDNARLCRLGLWSDKDPVSPWEWRKRRN